ncbi:sigma-70 family RNA polymerase sigma factor [Haloechinothrix sp. YIM 98757]|uniref:Sigma-70 family RNA polymerase sigma factor n=1 Tax=Haloechinothrix aidingensis TaxID=2752311 RepID=A0A838A782_9PSEU|nr:sigma-70 family RNA polymerase sigma factor [Haloechinothrix aidingensis]MBA0124119.1 sigma-70 family RNA polymerase sigma factor [Haloechinothrix aidingensis]
MTSTSSASRSDDAELLRRLRRDDDAAFSELFELHAAAVRRLARGLTRHASEAEDITSETFFRVLQAVRRGSGPTDSVRGYLLTVARRVAMEHQAASRDVPVTDEELSSRAGSYEHGIARSAERSLITRAFSSLPARWRAVLWQTEVEGEQPAVIAPNFGLNANATAALARRARQGLRAAYLQAHLSENERGQLSAGCGDVLDKLGGYTAGSVTGAEARRVRMHLAECAFCATRHDELRDVSFSLREHAAALAAVTTASSAPAAAAAGDTAAAAAASWFGRQVVRVCGAVQNAVGGVQVKVAIAVTSTAAAGVFGFTAAAQLSDAPPEIIGLPGQQGVPELTAERTSERDGPHGVVPPRPEELNEPDGSWGVDAGEGEDTEEGTHHGGQHEPGEPAAPGEDGAAGDVPGANEEVRDAGDTAGELTERGDEADPAGNGARSDDVSRPSAAEEARSAARDEQGATANAEGAAGGEQGATASADGTAGGVRVMEDTDGSVAGEQSRGEDQAAGVDADPGETTEVRPTGEQDPGATGAAADRTSPECSCEEQSSYEVYYYEEEYYYEYYYVEYGSGYYYFGY